MRLAVRTVPTRSTNNSPRAVVRADLRPLALGYGRAMPASAVGSSGSALTRRRVLAGLGAMTLGSMLVGCTARGEPDPSPPGPPTPTRTQHPDARRREEAVAHADRLAAAYAATIEAHPALSTPLTALLADHQAHRDALSSGASPSPSPRGSTTVTTGAGGSSSGHTASTAVASTPAATGTATPPVAVDPSAARAELAALERQASDASRAAAVAAVDPAFARLLASIAASRAVHVNLLAALA